MVLPNSSDQITSGLLASGVKWTGIIFFPFFVRNNTRENENFNRSALPYAGFKRITFLWSELLS